MTDQTPIRTVLPPCDSCGVGAGEQCKADCPRKPATPAERKCATCDAEPGAPCSDGCAAWLHRLFDMCTASLPWARALCSNPATGADGQCDECRDEHAALDRWADEGESREDYERSNGPHAAARRFGQEGGAR